MPEQFILNLVTGAAAAGQSTSAQLCAATQNSYLAFDMDCLIDSASSLSQKDVHISPETWPAYNALWMDIVQAVLKNGAEAVLFTPIAPSDLSAVPAWCSKIRWLLLDCADEVLLQRLNDRAWEEDRIRDAILDAEELRTSGIETIIRTDELDCRAVADAITSWQQGPPG
jgi:hypothetical protein